MRMRRAAEVIAALERRADGALVLPVLGPSVALVGGFVRDALLGREPREVDLVVEGDAEGVAGELASRGGGELTSHPRFGTHTVRGAGWQVDVAEARTEYYAHRGALPEIAPAAIEADLGRRDFTVNAIALRDGELLCVPGAQEDLLAGRLRVLHPASFEDDPTRLVRLARYAERLRFDVEPETAALFNAASLRGLSPARLGGELRLAAREPDPLAVFARLGELGLDTELARRALALAPDDADRVLILLASCTPVPAIELTAGERSVLSVDRRALAGLLGACSTARASELHALLQNAPVETVALAGAHGAEGGAHGAEAAARRWLDELRHVRLEIGGEELIAAGVQPGPGLGARLRATLVARLDGELEAGPEAELRFALASAAE